MELACTSSSELYAWRASGQGSLLIVAIKPVDRAVSKALVMGELRDIRKPLVREVSTPRQVFD